MTQHPLSGTVPGRLTERASERPDDVAHEVVGVGRLTFKEWDDGSNSVAHGLAARSVSRGQRLVLTCGPRDWLTYAIAYVGAQRAGAIVVPVSQQLGEDHIARVARTAGAVGVIGAASVALRSAWRADVGELVEGQPQSPFTANLHAGDDAEILFTSGTTGTAKGVVATHGNLLYTHSQSRRGTHVRRVLHALPPGTLATQGLLLQPLDVTPHTVITLPEYGDRELLWAVQHHRATDLVLVPALAVSLTRLADYQSFDLSSVRIVRTMSAPIPPTALEKLDRLFDNAVVMNMYTTTEAWPSRTRARYSKDHPGSVGRVDGPGSVRIVDGAGQLVEDGSPGNVELALRDAPRRRYLDDGDQAGEVFLPDGWIRTGDTGYIDKAGYLYLVDRNADLVITGGLNVSTIEVEAAISEFAPIIDVAVFGMPHPILGEYLVAAIQATDAFSTVEFGRFLEQRLGTAKAPKRVVVLEKLPRNPTGKVLKQQLRDQLATRSADHRIELPEGVAEGRLRRIWSDALGGEADDRDASFMELGGTSLGALEIVARVRSELGREIGQRDIYDATGLAEFAIRVESAPAVTTTRRYDIQRVARTPAGGGVFKVPSKYSQELYYDAKPGGWSNANIPLIALLGPEYDSRALELALGDLIQRHEALRTSLVRAAGAVLQQVHETAELRLERVTPDADGGAEDRRKKLVEAAAYAPFCVHGGDLVRTRICRIEPDLDILVVSAHHAIVDGWSMGILQRDLVELYRARSEHGEAELPSLRLQLADYANWERAVIRSGPTEYWRKRLGSGNPRMMLDSSHTAGDAPGRCRAFHLTPVSPAVTKGLDSLADAHRTTRARVLVAAVIASIYDYLPATATIGVTTANRNQADLLNVVGDLANVVPVRADLPRDPTFSELVTRFDTALSQALENQLPFGALEDLLRQGSNRATVSALDVTVNYVPAPKRSASNTSRLPQLVRDEELPWELDTPDLEIDQWWKTVGTVNYDFSPRRDGGVDVGVWADISAISEDMLAGLGPRLTSVIDRVSLGAANW